MWLTDVNVCSSLADPANKAKLILLLGGFNNTRELESQLKRISVPQSAQSLHALMIMKCHQHSHTPNHLADSHTNAKYC